MLNRRRDFIHNSRRKHDAKSHELSVHVVAEDVWLELEEFPVQKRFRITDTKGRASAQDISGCECKQKNIAHLYSNPKIN